MREGGEGDCSLCKAHGHPPNRKRTEGDGGWMEVCYGTEGCSTTASEECSVCSDTSGTIIRHGQTGSTTSTLDAKEDSHAGWAQRGAAGQ